MDAIDTLGHVLAQRGLGTERHPQRQIIAAVEHETKILPPDIVGAGGVLDIYRDVLTRFELRFKEGRPAVQCGRWVGYVPLNDRYALEVGTRVPVGNLERLIGLADYRPETLEYLRAFAHTAERPSSVFDILSDRLLVAFDKLWDEGLSKAYERRSRVGISPVGKISPFESAWRSKKAGRPIAASSAYVRTPDTPANRMLRHAFERLFVHYRGTALETAAQRNRMAGIVRDIDRLGGVGRPSFGEASPQASAAYLRHLPVHHTAYAEAIVLAQIIIAEMGLAIRGSGGLIALPSILVNMETVFETYVRRTLSDRLSAAGVEVLNGNVDGAGGAKVPVFVDMREGLKNPPATPDIVLRVGGTARLIIDVKYRPSQPVPEASERNQVVGYGARYDCDRIMIVYAGRKPTEGNVALVGSIGRFRLHTGHVDLNAEAIQDEEEAFAQAIQALLAR